MIDRTRRLVIALTAAVGLAAPAWALPDPHADGRVDGLDLLAVLSAWGPCPGASAPCPSDIDGSGDVGAGDLAAVLAAWGATTEVVPLAGCAILDRPGATYVLERDVEASGDCLVVAADGIVLDGGGVTVTAAGSGRGVVVTGRHDVRVRDLRLVGFAAAVHVAASSHVTLAGLDAEGGGAGIRLDGATGCVVRDVVATGNAGDAVSLVQSHDNVVEGLVAAANGRGVGLHFSHGNTVRACTTSGGAHGIALSNGSSGNVLLANEIEAAETYGLYFENAPRNVAHETVVRASDSGVYVLVSPDLAIVAALIERTTGPYAIYLSGDATDRTLLADVTVVDPTPAHYEFDLFVATEGVDDIRIVGGTIGRYAFDHGATLEVATAHGRVRFAEPVLGDGLSLTGEVAIDPNLASIQAATNPGLDVPAVVELGGMPAALAAPIILRDGVPCAACAMLERPAATTAAFVVPGAGTYSIAESKR